jgi:hypothetical protein
MNIKLYILILTGKFQVHDLELTNCDLKMNIEYSNKTWLMELLTIQNKVFTVRGKKVMLDFDLAQMYEVETRALKQAVRRNLERFPEDFMFELSPNEILSMVSQFVIPSKGQLGGASPFAFTEQGVAMLSSVLKSKKAYR